MKEQILEKWNDILNHLQNEYNIPSVSYNIWLKNLKVKDVEGDTVILYVDDAVDNFAFDLIKNKYGIYIRSAISVIMDKEFNFTIVTKDGTEATSPTVTFPENKETNKLLSLTPDYTFDNFIVSSNNDFTYSAALKVAEAPGEYYNPLFIYGDAGLGKTHLMNAIAHFILENSPSLKVMYVTSEKFMNDLIEAIRHGNISPADFREKYRNIDVLLIDDIQFIIGKDSTQEEFFHTFNALHEARKQIVISSDKPPKDMATLEERLRSRFAWGVITGLSSPDFETKMAILKKKVETKRNEIQDYDIGDDILTYIASNINSNIRELEGALNTVFAMAKIKRVKPDLALAEVALRNMINPNAKKVITPELIIDIVAEHFGITTNDIISPKRDRSLAYPRQIAMYLCKTYTECNITGLSNIFNKDHSTIIHGHKTISQKNENDMETRKIIGILTNKINPN